MQPNIGLNRKTARLSLWLQSHKPVTAKSQKIAGGMQQVTEFLNSYK